jgi:hypothetical protein
MADEKTFDTDGAQTISREAWEITAVEIAYLKAVEQNRRVSEEKKRNDDTFSDEVFAQTIYLEAKYFLNFIGFMVKIREEAKFMNELVSLKNFDTKKFQDQSDIYFRQLQTANPVITPQPGDVSKVISQIDALIAKTQAEATASWGSTDWQTGLSQQAGKLVENIGNPFTQLDLPKNLDLAVKTEMQTEVKNMQSNLLERMSHRKQPEEILRIIAESHAAAIPQAPPLTAGEAVPMAPPLTMNFLQNARRVASKAITNTEVQVAVGALDLYKKFSHIVNPDGKKQLVRMGADFAKSAVGAIHEFHHKIDQFREHSMIIKNLSQAKDQLTGIVGKLEHSLQSKSAGPSLRR